MNLKRGLMSVRSSEKHQKVSIVIPVFNGSNYLREAIDSALAQTYQNIEIIVVNDGSNDSGKTRDIAHSYGDKIRYFEKENGGVSTALNLGIKEMKGEYFAWLSHDDTFSANRIEEDVELFNKYEDLKITYCNSVLTDSNGNIIKEYDLPYFEIRCPWDLIHFNLFCMCAMTIHKSCFYDVGLFNEFNRTTQDVEMCLLLSRRFKFIINNQARTFTRIHSEQGTVTLTNEIKTDSILFANMLYKCFSFAEIFPFIDSNDDVEVSNCWSKIGDFYGNHGAYAIADQCYDAGYNIQRKIISKSGVKRIIGAKWLNNKIVIWLLAKLKVLF